MKKFLTKCRKLLQKEFGRFWDQKKKTLGKINEWGPDLVQRLRLFVSEGKMIRGALVILSYLMGRGRINRSVLRAAMAMELVHSALLVHDDIMDQDLLRRGEKTLFAQYADRGRREKFVQARHFGESMGICAGDILFFMAFELMSGIPCEGPVKEKILAFWAEELAWVGLGQMQDVYFGSARRPVTEKEILSLYLYKTARYTFSLPLVLGALLSGQGKKNLISLEKLGEDLGLVFQIKDDELGLFGQKIKTGKPVGSDIKEGKKTIFYHHLFKRLKGARSAALKKEYAKGTVNPAFIGTIRSLVESSGAREAVNRKCLKLSDRAGRIIRDMNVQRSYRRILEELLLYSRERRA